MFVHQRPDSTNVEVRHPYTCRFHFITEFSWIRPVRYSITELKITSAICLVIAQGPHDDGLFFNQSFVTAGFVVLGDSLPGAVIIYEKDESEGSSSLDELGLGQVGTGLDRRAGLHSSKALLYKKDVKGLFIQL